MTPQSSAARKSMATSHERATLSGGASELSLYESVGKILQARRRSGGALIDVGCGNGSLQAFLPPSFSYLGVDINRYANFPASGKLIEVDLNARQFPIDSGIADIVVSVETIEHLENPRGLFRELHRIVKPGGLVILTTPNQLSLLSKITLVFKNQFNAFQDASYPAHITALLEGDLVRIAREVGLVDIEVSYTGSGRIPFTAKHWPKRLGFRGRLFSDNLLLSAVRSC